MNLYSFSVQSPCQNNGGCSQLCVLTPHGRTCICGAGMKLAEDGISCKSLNLILLHLLHLLFLIITLLLHVHVHCYNLCCLRAQVSHTFVFVFIYMQEFGYLHVIL